MKPIQITSVRKPRFVAEDKSQIDCLVQFDHVKGEVEFTASQNDCEEYGREIWARCMNGEFGKVEGYEATEQVYNNDDASLTIPDEYIDFTRFIEIVNKENAKGSYLSVAMLWLSKIDSLVSELLDTYFAEHPELRKTYHTLNLKIKASVDIGLISSDEKLRLDNLRAVRNILGHEWEVSIENPDLKSALYKLYCLDHKDSFEFVEDVDFLVRMIYSSSSAMVAMNIKTQIESLKQRETYTSTE